MAKGVNKVIIVGNLGADPEVKYFPNGGAICNVTVATSESWKDKQTGEPREATEWHRVVFKGKVAEIANQYLSKGSKVYIEGSLKTRKWQNQQGVDQYTTEIMARDMQMLDSKPQGDSYAPQQGYQPQQPTQQPQQGYQQAPQQPHPTGSHTPSNHGQPQGYQPQQGGYPQPQGGYSGMQGK